MVKKPDMLAHFTIMTKRIDTCYATGKLLTFFIATFGISIFLSSCLGTKDSYYFKTLKKEKQKLAVKSEVWRVCSL